MPLQPNGLGSGEQAYTPILTATTTDPDLGSGGIARGGWQYVSGSLVWFWALIMFGEDPDPGEGIYQISLPHFPVENPGRAAGDGVILDSSASNEGRPVRAACSEELVSGLGGIAGRPFLVDVSDPAPFFTALVGAEAPFTFAELDQINISGIYQMLG